LNIHGMDSQFQSFENCMAENGSGGSVYINSLAKAVGRAHIMHNEILSADADSDAGEDGGGIYIRSGNAHVDAISLYNNVAGDASGVLSAGNNGGAFYFEIAGSCDTFNIIQNNFNRCKADESGGAVYFTSNGLGLLNIQGTEDQQQLFKDCQAQNGSGGSVFVNIQSQPIQYIGIDHNDIYSLQQIQHAGIDGGAIYIKALGPDVDHILISDNVMGNQPNGIKSGNNGGAFFVELAGDCSQLDITGNVFYQCSAGGSGGAVYLKAAGIDRFNVAGTADVDQLFSDCYATGYGGSLFLSSQAIGMAAFSSNQFTNSHANIGGAMSLSYNTLNSLGLMSVDFDQCQATSNGGSINLMDIDTNGEPEIEVFTISECSFTQSKSEAGHGGAIYYMGSIGDFFSTGNSFIENSCDQDAGHGAAIYFDLMSEIKSNLSFSDDTIQDCSSATGGIYLKNINLAGFYNAYFQDNTATSDGAALAVQAFDTVFVMNSLFSQNSSDESGGALFIDSGTDSQALFHFESCEVEFNKSVKGGAITMSQFNKAEVRDNSFIQNTCEGNANEEAWGGAIYSNQNDGVDVINNVFIRNSSIINPAPDLLSYGGSLYVMDPQQLSISDNKFYFSTAEGGGAIYTQNTSGSATASILNQGNLFFSNSGVYGGAIYAKMQDQDVMTSTQNMFYSNNADFSGGAVDLRNLSEYVSTRNIFKRNRNNGLFVTEGIGGAALFCQGVSGVKLYNTVFDENFYSADDSFEKQPTAWFKNSDSVYIENGTFRYHTPNSRSILYQEGLTNPVFIINTIFTKNLNSETPIINGSALFRYSALENDEITPEMDLEFCFIDYTGPGFMPESYILNDTDSIFIDAGDPLESYNDSIHYPIGKGTHRCDLGVSGGRYNVWDKEDLDVPSFNDQSRAIKVERYNEMCNWYKIYFALLDDDNFTDFNWYIDDSIFNTGSTNELIKYIATNQFIPVTGIASDDNSGLVIIGNDTINSSQQVTYSDARIQYAGSEYQCGAEIILNDTCPSTIENIKFKFFDLQIPFFDSYDFNWSLTNLVGIESNSIVTSHYNDIVFDLVMIPDNTQNRSLTIEYSGSDNICNIQFSFSCSLNFIYDNLNENLQVIQFPPQELELDPQDIYLELEFNAAPYYCNGAEFYKLQEGIDPPLDIISIVTDPGNVPVQVSRIEYVDFMLKIFPDELNFTKGDYTVFIDHVCNSCGFPFEDSFNVNVKYVGIGSHELEGIKIWPNPASDLVFVYLDNNQHQLRLQMINALGQVVRADLVQPGTTCEIDVSILPKGMYYIRIYDDKVYECYYRKLIVE